MRSSVYVRIFLVGAAVACARSHPESRADSGDAEALVQAVIRRGGDVRVCGLTLGYRGGPGTGVLSAKHT